MTAEFAQNGIRRALTRNLFVPMLFLVLIATSVLSVINYQLINEQLKDRVAHIGESSTKIFENLLWQLDVVTIQVLLDEHVALGAVTSARLRDTTGLDLQAGDTIPSHLAYTVIIPLHKELDGVRTQIGQLHLQASLESVWREVWFRAIATILVAATAILGTTFLVRILLERTLLKPVLKISKTLTNWTGDWSDLEIDLGRTSGSSRAQPTDELDDLVRSIHEMRDQILASQGDLADSQRRLLRAAQIAGVGYSSFDIETGQYVTCDENYATMVNQTITEMLALSVIDDIILKRMHPDDIQGALAVGQKMRRGEIAEGVFRVAVTPGDFRYIRQIFEPGLKTPGHRQLVHTVAQDVTEINQLQSNLLQAQKVEAIGKLTGGVAHDFNNILAIISGNLELLRCEITPSDADEFVATSMRAVESGSKLTRQLLAFARKQPLMPRVFDVSVMIKESAALLKSSVGESIAFEIVTDGSLWKAEADPAQLEAAVLNLVVNARDAMPDGGKLTIEVGNTRLDRVYASQNNEVSPGQYVCIAVTDSGVGMSPKTLARVMEPYFTTKAVGRGTGLGLSMAFGFAKQSGGHLKVYSEIGRGTTVKLYLPRTTAMADQPTPKDTGIWGTEFDGLSVFLVEDDADLLNTYTKQLEKLGCLVHPAHDAASAQTLAQRVPKVDVILCDVILPGGQNGPEVVKNLKEHYPDCAVIYMSGFTENAIIHHGRLDKGVIMLEKPFTMANLRLAFKRAMSPTA